MTTYFGTTFHGIPGVRYGHPDQRRNSTLHVDARQFAQEVRAWLARVRAIAALRRMRRDTDEGGR